MSAEVRLPEYKLPVVTIAGFMGTGKSSVGRELAELTGLELVDTDAEIERTAGKSIADIFAQDGEDRFRELESQLCQTLAEREGIVIACGGGMVLDPHNLATLNRIGPIVLLTASSEALADRLAGDTSRPLLGDVASDTTALRERIDDLLAKRADAYNGIPLKFDTTARIPAETAASIAAMIDFTSDSVRITPAGGDDAESMPLGRYGASELHIGRGVLSSLGRRLREHRLGKAFLLMPPNLIDLYFDQVRVSLDEHEFEYELIEIVDGDEAKHIQQTKTLIDAIIDNGAKRDATIVPIGGGVTGDIGGFVASLYMRGVPLVQVPTTLLAQVDSAIGGKVGVNHEQAKNLIGAFYQPHVILEDPCTLRTLPLEEVSNGMAEVVKSALIASEPFFEFLESHIDTDAAVTLRDVGFLETCVRHAARVKVQLVNEDPYERDRRRYLNLGHTLGHALEAAGDYKGLKHGQAVSVGIVAAMKIAADRGTVSTDVHDRTARLLEWCRLPIADRDSNRDIIRSSMQLDKKFKRGRLHFILPTGIGSATVVDDVTTDEIIATQD